jgi:hypothetical protein
MSVPNAAPQQTKSKVSLGNVVKGKQEVPYRIALYAPEGVGKSTFAANAPKPIFIAAEDGTFHLDVERIAFDDKGRTKPETWGEVIDAVRELQTAKHDYKTVVIDTVDAVEPLIARVIIEAANSPKIKTLEDFGFGKGPAAALEYWRVLLQGLEALYAKGMNVILIAHAQVKRFNSPEVALEPFDRYQLKLAPTAAALIREWCHTVMFANHEILTSEDNGRAKGVSTGARLMHTVHAAAWDAKNRYGLPEKLSLSWDEFDRSAKTGREKMKTSLAAEIKALAETANVELKAQALGALERAGDDADKLAQLLDWLKTKVVTTNPQ